MLDEINADIRSKVERLRRLTNSDGGIPAYLEQDESGVWASAEVLFLLLENGVVNRKDELVGRIAGFIETHQHEDGGWSYRTVGNSFVDPTAWAMLALSLCPDEETRLIKGAELLLRIQHADDRREDGWGIQAGESDRTYSTAIAIAALSRVRRHEGFAGTFGDLGRVDEAIRSGLRYLLDSRNSDNGWGPRANAPSNVASTAHALQCLLRQGADPAEHRASLAYLLGGRVDGTYVWESVDEVLPLKMGLEVTMQWFAHPECLKVLLLFGERGMVDVGVIAQATQGLMSFSAPDHGKVTYSPTAPHKAYSWTIPHYLEALCQARAFLQKHKREFDRYLTGLRRETEDRWRKQLHARLEDQVPYPVAEAFFRCSRETDQLTRFRRMILSIETLTVFFASVAIVAYSHAPARLDDLSTAIAGALVRPSFGVWHGILERILAGAHAGPASGLLGQMSAALRTKVSVEGDETVTDVRSGLARFIELRNKHWGHGSVVSAQEYKKLCAVYMPLVEHIYERFAFLEGYNLFYVVEIDFDEFDEKEVYTVTSCNGVHFSSRQSRIESSRRLSKGTTEPEARYLYLQDTRTGDSINLYPLWLMRHCDECKSHRFFAFSSRKESTVEYVSYECGHFLAVDSLRHLEVLLNRLKPARAAAPEKEP